VDSGVGKLASAMLMGDVYLIGYLGQVRERPRVRIGGDAAE